MPLVNDDSRRKSVAEEPTLIVDSIRIAEAEIANGLRQFDAAKNLVLDDESAVPESIYQKCPESQAEQAFTLSLQVF